MADGGLQSDFERILAVVRERCGVDFRCYRPANVQRRILNRMLSAGVRDSGDYLAMLRQEPDEAGHLLERLTIKVSRFFRNRPVFDALQARMLREWHARARPLRIWSAGCSRGEEAHTLALMMLRHGIPGTVLATDIDPQAIAAARAGRYGTDSLVEMTAAEVDACFECVPDESGMRQVDARVRARVRFARHDLTTCLPPVPERFDLISCRNVMIYFSPDTQRAVQRMLVDALAPGGYLCLGEAEWPDGSLAPLLAAMPRKLRTFRRLPVAAGADAR